MGSNAERKKDECFGGETNTNHPACSWQIQDFKHCAKNYDGCTNASNFRHDVREKFFFKICHETKISGWDSGKKRG